MQNNFISSNRHAEITIFHWKKLDYSKPRDSCGKAIFTHWSCHRNFWKSRRFFLYISLWSQLWGKPLNQTRSWSAKSLAVLKTIPFFPGLTSSLRLSKRALDFKFVKANYYFPYQLYSIAQTGRLHPNISSTFIGRSSPDDEVCRQTPRSALAGQQLWHDILTN